MSGIVIFKYNESLDAKLMILLHDALNYGGDKEYICILPKKFIYKSSVIIDLMIESSYSFKYVETEETFFFSSHH